MSEPTQEQVEATPDITYSSWPASEDFLDDKKGPEAIAFAAYEILTVLEHVNKAAIKCASGKLPMGVKMAFTKKLRTSLSQLYLGVPNQMVQAVEAMVITELFGAPDAVEKLVDGSVDATEATGAVTPVPQGQDGSSPSVPTMPTYGNTTTPEGNE